MSIVELSIKKLNLHIIGVIGVFFVALIRVFLIIVAQREREREKTHKIMIKKRKCKNPPECRKKLTIKNENKRIFLLTKNNKISKKNWCVEKK